MTKKSKKLLIIVLSIMLFGLFMAYAAMYGKEDYNKIKDKFNDLTQEEVIESRNLVYNADFQINSKNVASYTEENGGTMSAELYDGWMNTNGKCTDFEIVSVSNGLYVKVSSEQALNISQFIKEPDKVIGNTITLSMSIDGVVYSKTFEIGESSTCTLETTELTFSLIVTEAGTARFLIGALNGFEGIINWVQVEQGPVFTGFAQGPSTYEVA